MAAEDFLSYRQAVTRLASRIHARSEEIAVWVFMGPELGGLSAYCHIHEFADPPRFYFYFDGQSFDYLSPLAGCYFRATDIESFQPGDHYITWGDLILRWRQEGAGEDQAEAMIYSRIAQSRLQDLHPITGLTQASSPSDNLPPAETALFSLKEVEAIESRDYDQPITPFPSRLFFPACGDLLSRRIALRDAASYRVFAASEQGKRHWKLVCQAEAIKKETRKLEIMAAHSESMRQLEELRAKLTKIEKEMTKI